MSDQSEIVHSSLELAQRLERAEGQACLDFAQARGRLFPESGATWMHCEGTYAIFDGVDSPVTQTFGLGLNGDLRPAILDEIERFFLDRHAPVFHEVSPFAGAAALDLLCRRSYRPVEVSNVLCQKLGEHATEHPDGVTVRVIGSDETQLWGGISVRGWSDEHPELVAFLQEVGTISAARTNTVCFLGEVNGRPGCAGALCLHQGVALLGGSATVPELRRRGLHTAILRERLRYAITHGCDVAMVVTHPGSESQRNAERRGFRVAYTRTKWQLKRESV